MSSFLLCELEMWLISADDSCRGLFLLFTFLEFLMLLICNFCAFVLATCFVISSCTWQYTDSIYMSVLSELDNV